MPPKPISEQDKIRIVNMMNAARKDVKVPAAGMRKITGWNYELENALKEYLKTHDARDLFEGDGVGGGKLMMNLMNEPEFYKFGEAGWKYMFHDSYSHDVATLIKNRIKQKHCFDFTACDPKSYFGYATCLNKNDKNSCNWFFQYYPVIVDDRLVEIACVPLDAHGPNAPKSQKYTFVCYGHFVGESARERNQPYAAGEPGSKCPKDYPVCIDGLCSPKEFTVNYTQHLKSAANSADITEEENAEIIVNNSAKPCPCCG